MRVAHGSQRQSEQCRGRLLLPQRQLQECAWRIPLSGRTDRREPWNVSLCQVQAASVNRGDAGVPNQWSQLFGEAFAQAAAPCGNGWGVGVRANLPRQHAPEHPPHVVTRHGLNTSGAAPAMDLREVSRGPAGFSSAVL